MTTKTANPHHVVVDGSNIATEGRSMPSLAQLNEAVNSYISDHPGVRVTVVVDATFGHRIAPSEVKEFDAAIANNELVAPPAGAIGRGDAFVLSIAKKAKATILSNDSFQEFHGEHEWLFDDDRLVGGKPVPHVGWVWVSRNPVRGPISRKAVRASKPSSARDAAADEVGTKADREPGARRGSARRASKEAAAPMPVPTSPPPGRAAPPGGARAAAAGGRAAAAGGRAAAADTQAAAAGGRAAAADTRAAATPSTAPTGDVVNELMPFLDFVQHHPVGTSVNAIVDSYSSHGAYVKIGNVFGYVPLRLMSDPPPRSARDVMHVGDAVTLVVASFAPARRSIDCAVPNMASVVEPQDGEAVVAEAAGAAAPRARKAAGKKAAAKPARDAAMDLVAASPPKAAKKAATARAAKQATTARARSSTTTSSKASATNLFKEPTSTVTSSEAPARKAARRAPSRRTSTSTDNVEPVSPAARARRRGPRTAGGPPGLSSEPLSVTAVGVGHPETAGAAAPPKASKPPRRRAAKVADA